jgi:hypothetical protein
MADPNPQELLALHQALCRGDDPTASAVLAELLLLALRRRTYSGIHQHDPQMVESAIGMSVARYLQRPEVWDPSRGTLLAYLYQDVRGDLRNELEAGRRRHARETVALAVELSSAARNTSVEEEALDHVDPFDMPPDVVRSARLQLDRLSEQDRELVALLADKVRSTAAYAAVLGITHLPVEIQQAEVKRHKDRLQQWLRRVAKAARPR